MFQTSMKLHFMFNPQLQPGAPPPPPDKKKKQVIGGPPKLI